MRRMRKTISAAMAVLLFALFPLVATGGTAAALNTEGPPRLIIVDRMCTFASTVRAGTLHASGMVDISVQSVDVQSNYEDHLDGIAGAKGPYNITLIVPRGLDDGAVRQIWLVSRFFAPGSVEHAGFAALSGIVDQIFHGIAEAIDLSEDLFPRFFATLYLAQGWLR